MASTSKMITFVSSDGEKFELEEEVAKKSQIIDELTEDGCGDMVFTLPNIAGKILSKVLEYCNKHYDAGENNENISAEELEAWDNDLVRTDEDDVYDLLLAANYLSIKNLSDLTCRTVADMIKGKPLEEIRKTLRIKSDFIPGEEEEIKEECSWSFE